MLSRFGFSAFKSSSEDKNCSNLSKSHDLAPLTEKGMNKNRDTACRKVNRSVSLKKIVNTDNSETPNPKTSNIFNTLRDTLTKFSTEFKGTFSDNLDSNAKIASTVGALTSTTPYAAVGFTAGATAFTLGTLLCLNDALISEDGSFKKKFSNRMQYNKEGAINIGCFASATSLRLFTPLFGAAIGLTASASTYSLGLVYSTGDALVKASYRCMRDED